MAFPPTSPPLARALTERDYNDPTAVQMAVLAPDAATRDLLVSAQTGSGKTIAFGLAIASNLLGDAEVLPRAGAPLALVVAPTRELALQVHRELSWLYQHAGTRIVACVGGMDPRQEKRQLIDGCHIVVGTPGRLRDHLERHSLKISGLKAVVLDEADEMLDLGFREDLEFLLEATPKERRTLLFSATLPRGIVALAKSYQRNAFSIESSAVERGHADIEYRAMRITAHDTEHAVVNVLRFFESPSTLVFCNKRETVRHLNAILLERGFSVVSLSGEFSQSERNAALQALRDGKARVCVATDVAARGIDLPTLGLVIHADLPNDSESLQHRSGRTGRAGRKGVSVMLIPPSRRRHAERLLGSAGIKAVWCGVPTAEVIRKLDHERLLESMLQSLSQVDADHDEDVAMAKELLAQRSSEDIAAALVRVYRSKLPAAEDVTDAGIGYSAPDAGYVRKQDRGQERPRDQRSQNFTAPSSTVWFRLNLGRQDKADPKYLIPEICRQGDITKRHIGVIRIMDHETRFEVDSEAAAKFADLVGRTKGKIRIERAEMPSDGQVAPKPHESHQSKPYEAKPHVTKPIQTEPNQSEKASATPRVDKSQWQAKRKDRGPARPNTSDARPVHKKKFGPKPWAGLHKKKVRKDPT